jgi:hypothetical protein
MVSILSRSVLGCGMAMALLTPALAAGTCLTLSGPVEEGGTAGEACMNPAALNCPAGGGPVFQCRNGKWYCQFASKHPPHLPCADDKAGAWVWTKDKGLQRGE